MKKRNSKKNDIAAADVIAPDEAPASSITAIQKKSSQPARTKKTPAKSRKVSKHSKAIHGQDVRVLKPYRWF